MDVLTVFVVALGTALATGLGALPFVFARQPDRTWESVRARRLLLRDQSPPPERHREGEEHARTTQTDLAGSEAQQASSTRKLNPALVVLEIWQCGTNPRSTLPQGGYVNP